MANMAKEEGGGEGIFPGGVVGAQKTKSPIT